MTIQIAHKEPDILWVTFEGEMDYHVSTHLRDQMNKVLETKPSKILLDFAKVTYMDSSGIAAFVEFSQKAKAFRSRIVFTSLTEPVRQVFTLAKLHLFFSIAGSEQEALKLLA